jgi:hypothetical protein
LLYEVQVFPHIDGGNRRPSPPYGFMKLRNYLKTAAQHVIASGAKQSLSHAWA